MLTSGISSTNEPQGDIASCLAATQKVLSDVTKAFEQASTRLEKLETRISGSSGNKVQHDLAFGKDVNSTGRRSYIPVQDLSVHHPIPNQYVDPEDCTCLPLAAEDELKADPGPPSHPGNPAILMNHRTPAGLLLSWNSIQVLTKRHFERVGIRHISEFPISQEQNRGHLRVYGRDEAPPPSRQVRGVPGHGHQGEAYLPPTTASLPLAVSPSHLGGPDEQVGSPDGVLAFDGNPDFTDIKVW